VCIAWKGRLWNDLYCVRQVTHCLTLILYAGVNSISSVVSLLSTESNAAMAVSLPSVSRSIMSSPYTVLSTGKPSDHHAFVQLQPQPAHQVRIFSLLQFCSVLQEKPVEYIFLKFLYISWSMCGELLCSSCSLFNVKTSNTSCVSNWSWIFLHKPDANLVPT